MKIVSYAYKFAWFKLMHYSIVIDLIIQLINLNIDRMHNI